MYLKKGIILRPFGAGSSLSGEVSEDVVKYLIDSGKAKESDFQKTNPEKKESKKGGKKSPLKTPKNSGGASEQKAANLEPEKDVDFSENLLDFEVINPETLND
ncbi:hypothetical protein Phi46:1_gp02 [Cellulophaga phage phi46:1]|uniref:hypothetical protein n=1 Tax=Cellulophaga phage phi46:1 TaxID=1327974 RepID=UPI000351DCA8|nr:hypothetical protein Phi46:1_gp02 [Cellulophaga phage phi46:1]AGO47813.1 hypothetical protein Phi46:1_gp02 [Cellulophaga phage phi46:1]